MSFYETKFSSTILVIRQDGTIYDLGKLGYRVKSFDPPSPQYTHTYHQFGKHGVDLVDTRTQQITIPLVLDIIAYDTQDFELKRMQLHYIFDSEEEFYVVTTRMPYLRWKVVAEPFTANQLNSFWRAKDVSISLTCPDGYAESTATTLKPFTYDANSWGMAEFLPLTKYPYYEFTTPKMEVFNAGTIPLLAEEHPVTITFKGNAPNGVVLKNNTTGQSMSLKHALTNKDTLIWHGLVPMVNGAQRYGNTWSDHGYLDFAKGWNKLTLSGSNNFKISFETRFYY